MQLCSKGSNCIIQFGGHELWLDASGALYWPAEQMLIISDLHFDKSGFLARFGSPLPRYDTRDTLAKIHMLIEKYQPESIVCLGDSFHDTKAYSRMHEEDKQALHALCQKVRQWHWVLGNHDIHAPLPPAGIPEAFIQRHNLLLTHEPEQVTTPQIIGHFHPKLHMQLSGQSVRGSCFVISEDVLMMPALGSYTGGLDVRDEAIMSCSRYKQKYYLLYRDRIWKL